MLKIKINSDEAIAAIERKAGVVTQPGLLLNKIGQDLAESAMQRFLKGASPDGAPWKAKSHVTLLRNPTTDGA